MFINNKVESNVYGLVLLNLNHALIYNNLFNNSENVRIGGARAMRNMNPVPGVNILGGGFVGATPG